MAEEEEKKVKQQWWTVDELEILLAYVQTLEPEEKVNYVQVVELLAAEGYERTEKQVQKKFERLRYESKAQNKDVETRLQDIIKGMKYEDDDEEPAENQAKSPKGSTPKLKAKPGAKKHVWTLSELQVLLECLLAGQDKTADVHDRLPYKEREKVSQKLTNVKQAAQTQGITVVELVKRQIYRLKGVAAEEKSDKDSSQENTPAKTGTKRKAENDIEERSAKKQRVIESPRLSGPKMNHDASSDIDEVKQLLEQLSNNNRVNFSNLRTYIRDKFEESRTQYEELKTQMTNMEEKMDLLLKELRASRASNGYTVSKNQIASQMSNGSNKDYNSNNLSLSTDSSPTKQPSYFKFL